MNDISDKVLIDLILAGQKMLFTRLVERYSAMAFTLAYRIIGNREDAEEVVQDAFVRIYEHLGEFRRKSKFSTWLYRIVYNAAISHTRKDKPVMEEIDNRIYSGIEDPGSGKSLFGLTEEEAVDFIRRAMAILSEEERTILTLYYLNESGIDEIHQITGLSKANIKVKLFRARKKLQSSARHISSTTELDNESPRRKRRGTDPNYNWESSAKPIDPIPIRFAIGIIQLSVFNSRGRF
jgi:RNA polymerase sigma-70 factor (ECF subfamily)